MKNSKKALPLPIVMRLGRKVTGCKTQKEPAVGQRNAGQIYTNT